MMHSLYFLFYGSLATFAGATVAWAQYTVYKREGAPFNYTLLKLIGGFATTMFVGAAVTHYTYSVYGTYLIATYA